MEIIEDSDSGESIESSFDLLDDAKVHTQSDVQTLQEEVSALRADLEFQKSKAYFSGFNEATKKADIKHKSTQFDLLVIFWILTIGVMLLAYSFYNTCTADAPAPAPATAPVAPVQHRGFVFEDQVYDDSL